MKLRIALSLLLLAVSGFACGGELAFQRNEICVKCPKNFNPGPGTTEKDLCTTGATYKIPIGTVSLKIQGNEVTGSFEFSSYRVFGEDEEHLYCQGFRSISGEFKGTLKGNIALVSYQHSWNESGEPDTAEILIKPKQIVWRSIGSQHGYLGMMPASMELPRQTSKTPASGGSSVFKGASTPNSSINTDAAR